MTVGLCTIISVVDMQVFTYVMATYEVALEQAIENFKGVSGIVERAPERLNPDNQTRETVFRVLDHGELVLVREATVGDAVLSVPPGAMPEMVDIPWPKPQTRRRR